MNHNTHRPAYSSMSIGLCLLFLCTLSACSTHQTNQQRLIQATEHIENPIRTLEARAELELLGSSERVSDDLLRTIIPDALIELSPGSSVFQRALTSVEQIKAQATDASSQRVIEPEEIDPQRATQALKLYTQARAMRQTGQGTDAIDLLDQAARLDPNSASIQRELGNALIISNDRVRAMSAFERAIELGDRSPRGLIHLASQASNRGDDKRVIWLTTQALEDNSISNHPMARSIAGVLLGTSEIKSGYLKAGCETLGSALDSFDTTSRDLRWKREIIEIMSQRSQLRILIGDAWASMGAHERAQESYTKAGEDVKQLPMALVARQIVSSLRQGYPASASLVFLDHLQHTATDLSTEERTWAKSLGSIEGISDVLGLAIGELRKRPDLPGSVRRMLLSVELEAQETSAAVRVLGAGGLDADDPILSIGVFKRMEDETDRYIAAVSILETNPRIAHSIALGLSRTLRDPVGFMHNHAHPKSRAGELLIASMGIGLGRADLIEHLDSVSADILENQSTQWLGVHAQAFAFAGKWEHASAIVDQLTTKKSADATRTLISTLIANQHPKSAWELVELQANDADASVQDLILGAKIAQSLNRYESAAAFLERASELDPYNEKIYEQLFLLRSSASPIGNEEDLRYIVRQLSSTRPRSTLFGLIRANELARNGLINEAEALLTTLNTKKPDQEIGYDLLLSIWKTWSTQAQPNALIDGVHWLEARLIANPNSVETILKSAQGYIELDDLDRSLELLKEGYARTGSYELARALELLLAGPLEQTEIADQHIIDRLGERQGIDPAIEYAGLLAKQATHEASAQLQALLIDNLPHESKLLPVQQSRLAQVVFTMAGSIETLNHETDILSVISLIENRTTALGFQLSRIKVLLLASLPELDMDGLINAVNLAVGQSNTDEQRNMLRGLPIQSLLGEDRPHEAILLTARFATLDNTLDTGFGIETYRLLAAVGTNTDMIGVLDLFEERGLLEETIALTTKELGTPNRGKPATTTDEQRADLAYTAAALTTAFQRPEQSASYYELSLSYDPDHAWSNNDYGYMLAEAGERMDYAVELLERAAAVLPNEASVIDSLAWVRYKMGNFEDFITPGGIGGGRKIRGAISLLMRANELDIKRENATIMLHLGDALWQGGYKERANNAWIGAEDIARSRIRLLNAQPNPNRNAIDAMSAELREIRYRLQDADSTGNPQIAPLASDTEPITAPEP